MTPTDRAKAALAANLALNSASGAGADPRALAWLRRAAAAGRLTMSRTFPTPCGAAVEWFWIPAAGLFPTDRDLSDAGLTR